MGHRRITTRLAVAAGILLGASGAVAAWNAARPSAQSAVPRSAGGVYHLLFAQPFTLGQGYAFEWRREQPQVAAGYLVVLEVDARRAAARQELEPVLYAGAQTAERINHGGESGRLVAIVPCATDGAGEPTLDLAATPFFFGTPALPEQVDASIVTRELARARDSGVSAPPADEVAAALELGGETRRFAHRGELLRHGASVLLAWSPADRELAQSMLAPLVE